MDKPLIDSLKREPYSKKELIEILKEAFPSDSREALRKRMERAIKKLKALDLVTEREEKYCWYIYLNVLDENYNVRLEHSKKLIPALRRVAGEFWVKGEDEEQINGFVKINDESIETHLIAYPEIIELREEYQKSKNRAKEEKDQFISRLNEKVYETFGDKIIETTGLDSGSYVKITMASIIYKMMVSKKNPPIPAEIGGLGNVVMIGIARVSNDIDLVGAINDFIKKVTEDEFNVSIIDGVEKREEETTRIWKEFQKKIQELIVKIYSGEPLKPKCRTCPEVYNLSEK